ncbi:guanine nucleotide binding proteinalpha subunit [Penicillium desertorum]|uniref:Guanine nucleotide binding proteinalpha subunit n=1 Tax=Penicillium desertorum TaxID=1303715 RepID=A0A9X0BIK1_9EURO|nr:guanine nucleotide binding proteinalpha subunit [Penicillium desertorum]
MSTKQRMKDEDSKRDSDINMHLKSGRKQAKKTLKIPLLDASQSGKSKILRQMTISHSSTLSEEKRQETRAVVHENIINGFKVVLGNMASDNIESSTGTGKTAASLIHETAFDAYSEKTSISPLISDALKCLWNDAGFQTLSTSHGLPFYESLLQSIDLLSTPGWVPRNRDVLYARFRITEITETFFEQTSTKVQMIDLGGQQLGRKKSIRCFADVDCAVFVVALSSYNQHTVEGYNAMHQEMMLFDSLLNDYRFQHTPVILFLNKFNLLERKLAVSPPSNHFADFNGSDTDPYAAATFFAHQFQKINRTPERQIHAHTQSLGLTMASVGQLILQENWRHAGLKPQ